MAFEGFRSNGAPTYYDELKTPWEADLVTSGLIFSFVILFFSFLVILPGISGKEKWFTFIRICTSLYIGAVILVSNFSMTWETAETSTKTKYKAGTGHEVNVTVGVNIGLRGINITLKGEKDQIKGETIDYNEHFSWRWVQGRAGFGPFAGPFNQEYRAAQFRGLPLPILWAAEYFTFDGEGIRWGRFYRQAGWYAHIMLWLAFPLWLMSNILFFVLLRYGAYFLALTGLSMITCNIIWATHRNFIELKIPYTAHDVLEFSFGGSFWICLTTGIICILLGIVVFVLDKVLPNHIAIFFGVDVLQDSESILVEEEEETVLRDKGNGAQVNGGASSSHQDATDAGEDNAGFQDNNDDDNDDDELYLPPPPLAPEANQRPVSDRAKPYVLTPPGSQRRQFRTAEHRITKKFQRPRRRDPPPRPATNTEEEGEELYTNAPQLREAPPQRPTPPSGNYDNNASEDDLYVNTGAYEMKETAPPRPKRRN